MKDKTLKILLGIIALNLSILSVKEIALFPTASADVAGMDRGQLRRDSDFRAAVTYIVERRCSVSGTSISC